MCSCRSWQENEQLTTLHEHVPDGADCMSAQYCSDCGELLDERGSHDYSETPDQQEGGYSYFVCRLCGHIKIINQDGLPVIPVG